ncbi:hypothetical protein Tco_0328633 [Tanacetum coccineum]
MAELYVTKASHWWKPTRRDMVALKEAHREMDFCTKRLIKEAQVEYGVCTSTGYDVSSSLSNIAYSSQPINTAYPLPLDTMTKVIKGEFEKIKDIKVEDDSLACDSPLEVFNFEDLRKEIDELVEVSTNLEVL